ncbi:amino acid permease [Metabacillus sediminilitoris]|uniref:Amino acid permease n=2 Tax=Metabacillus sediminilitoris TaxID=2567941 RepID=A0A4S4C478_9BACI|nr:amino acid permease [Metabacillus sediminilitoris]QGQ48651.1 amino acid permease [Metabacillus sediminilitoris]THF82571.1 amino acid permease [Metabacillus sediminilitoris]
MSCSSGAAGQKSSKGKTEGDLKWWQLSLIGVGCTIGTGYFLGSSIGIEVTGASIVFSFLLAALGTHIVFQILAKMIAKDPHEGSFCYYARKAYGKWAGFSCGWNYWCSNILVMGSQLTALSILSRFWFPAIPLWVFAAGYAILSIFVVLTGTKGFDKIEDILAIVKFAAIIMFIILAAAALFGFLQSDIKPSGFPLAGDQLFLDGVKGFWASLIYAFYAYGGIEVIGIMAMRLKKKEDAQKAGTIMLLALTIVYILSLGLAVTLVSLDAFNEKESPFVTAMANYHLPFFPHVFNGAIIIAGFSTMTASLYGVTNLLATLAKDGDAPHFFAKTSKKLKNLPLASLGLATVGLLASIITALLLPGKIYEYITTAAGILLLYNWLFIIISALRLLTLKVRSKLYAYLGILLIIAAITGTLFEKAIRPGFFVSILFVAIIFIVCLFMKKHWKKQTSKIRYY